MFCADNFAYNSFEYNHETIFDYCVGEIILILQPDRFQLVIAVALADPLPPVWPKWFSATLVITTDERYMILTSGLLKQDSTILNRWFYDSELQLTREDGPYDWNGQSVLASVITDFSSQTITTIVYEGDVVTCQASNTFNATMPYLDFSDFSFVGLAAVNYERLINLLITMVLRFTPQLITESSTVGRLSMMK